MDESKTYIVEISRVFGDDSTIYLEADGEPVNSLFAVLALSLGGAAIVDNCYRSVAEAQKAWPEAVPPKPHHLTSEAIRQNCTIRGEGSAKKLT